MKTNLSAPYSQPGSLLQADFPNRLVTLCDGRTGLRGGLRIEARVPDSDPNPATTVYTEAAIIDFVASDETLDRYDEIISASGWRLEAYRRNPVFQNAHQYGDIVFTLGKALVTEIPDRPHRLPPLPRQVPECRERGVHPVALGDRRGRGGFQTTLIEQELLEVSAVGIPANPNALQLELKAGAIQAADLRETLELLRQLRGNQRCRDTAGAASSDPSFHFPARTIRLRSPGLCRFRWRRSSGWGSHARSARCCAAVDELPGAPRASGAQQTKPAVASGRSRHKVPSRNPEPGTRWREKAESRANMNSKTKTITITAAGVIGLAVLANIGLFGPDPGVLTATGLMLAIAPVGLTEEQLRELQTLVGEIRGDWIELKSLPAVCKGLQEETTRLREQVTDVRNLAAARGSLGRHRAPVFVSEACARHLAAQFVAHCQKSGKLEALSSASSQRDSLLEFARHTLNLSTRAALTTSDMPLPTQYGTEIRELISEFGVARKRMFPYPIGMGTARPARMGTRPAFGSIDLSAAFGEKSPSVEFASLESHKIGGMGQFLARYGAVEFARAEDTWAFLADGGAGYEGVKGVVQTALENEGAVVLAATKTKPRDATLDDFRALRRKVDKGALNGRLSAYYLDTTWETRLPAFRTAAEPNVYQRLPDGSASLDGYPIVWTDVLEPFGTAAAPGKPLAVFGALSFWWLAEHGTPRMDTSEHVWFANDQLAVRFIEEIDFDYAAQRATAALVTAAV